MMAKVASSVECCRSTTCVKQRAWHKTLLSIFTTMKLVATVCHNASWVKAGRSEAAPTTSNVRNGGRACSNESVQQNGPD